MAVLSLKDWRVRCLRRSHPLLMKKIQIGAGQFCRVFETQDPNRVLKLTVDSCHVAYLTDYTSPEGRYKPVVFEDFGEIGETTAGESVYLLEVERLQKLQTGSANARLARRLIRYSEDSRHWRSGLRQLPQTEEQLPGLAPDLYEFMEEINQFTGNYDCWLDLHLGNFMERTDGTLIFSDPVYDYKLKARSERRQAA